MTMKRLVLIVLLGMRTASFAADENAPEVKLTQDANHIHVEIQGKPFTDYWFGPRPDRSFTRPFFFPVLAADGASVTSDQYLVPKGDHPHHQSMWVAHDSVNGVDQWSLNGKPRPARQNHVKFEKVEGNTFVEDLDWEDQDPSKTLLHETRTMKFMAFPDGSRGIDWTVALTPADGDVTLADRKDAGLCSVRVGFMKVKTVINLKLQKTEVAEAGTITNSKGDTGEAACWGKSADWCDMSGTIDGKPFGIAIFDSPSNPRHPTTWHVRQYGLMTANPFGYHDFNPKLDKHAGDFKIEAGKTATFHYFVVVHEGDAAAAKLDEKYKQFVGN